MKQDNQLTKEKKQEVMIIENPQALDKPEKDTKFAHASAVFLKDIIKQNNWSKKLGGQSEHIFYEGWQTAGKYYGYTVKTLDAEYVEFGNSRGFKAKAKVINERTGIEVGGAEAFCMSDEPNWNTESHQNQYGKTIPGKPLFQLASMAQTRAGSKALRQILGFVIALAGYSPTPAEEIDNVVIPEKPQTQAVKSPTSNFTTQQNGTSKPTFYKEKRVSMKQETLILSQLARTGKRLIDMTQGKTAHQSDLTMQEASNVIKILIALPNKKVEENLTDFEMGLENDPIPPDENQN